MLKNVVLAVVVAAILAAAAGVLWLLVRNVDQPPPVALATDEPPEPSDDGPPPVGTLPDEITGVSDHSPDGEWLVAGDGWSFAGYRAREQLGNWPLPYEAVGRSRAVSGRATIRDGMLVAARFTVALDALSSSEETRDALAREEALDVARHPVATFRLTEPVDLDDVGVGAYRFVDVPGEVTVRDATVPALFDTRGRFDGDEITLVARAQLRLSDLGITSPTYALLASVQDLVTVELQLRLVRA